MKTPELESRLKALEQASMNPAIAGTRLERFLDSKAGLCWELSVGALSLPKMSFTGCSIDECLTAAEKKILKK